MTKFCLQELCCDIQKYVQDNCMFLNLNSNQNSKGLLSTYSVRHHSNILQVHGHYNPDVGTESLHILQERNQAQEVKSFAQLGRLKTSI